MENVLNKKGLPYCSRCKKDKIPLVKYSRVRNTQYNYCRSCNANRMKIFRHTLRSARSAKNPILILMATTQIIRNL